MINETLSSIRRRSVRTPLQWHLAKRRFRLADRTLVMGILNATPDSFSDGGLWFSAEAAVAHGLQMLDQGADIIDIGGESTRPGSAPTDVAEEQRRVLPVIRKLLGRRPEAILSVDTYHAETAGMAIQAGAAIVNDVSGGLWDDGMRGAWDSLGCGVVLMHTRGRPQEWRSLPPLSEDEVVPLVMAELRVRTEEALTAGVAREAIAIDPGFGFGKMMDENWPLLAGLGGLAELGFPIVAGVSRKGFLRRAIETSVPETHGQSAAALRDATIAANTAAVLAGAHILRVHDVPAGRCAAAVADRILGITSWPFAGP